MQRPVFLLIALLVLFAAGVALPATLCHAGNGRESPRHAVMARLPFNDEVAFLGLTYSYTVLPDLGLALTTGFDSRLVSVTARERIRPHFLIQRRETSRTLFILGAEETYMFGRVVGVVAGAGMGFSWGNYEGTMVDPDEGWTPTVEAGLQFRWQGKGAWGQFRVGYQYADIIAHPGNRAYVALGAAF